MPETVFIWLSALVFLPAAFAFGLLLLPTRWPEAMRWWALFGTAGTLSVSLCVVVGYYNLLDQYPDANGYPRYSIETRLDVRADQAASDAARDVPRYMADDWVIRRPWISCSIFNIGHTTGRGWHQLAAGGAHGHRHIPGCGRELENREVRAGLSHARSCSSKPAFSGLSLAASTSSSSMPSTN